MFLTFTKNEFINKFNEEGFGNTPPPASISKLISRFHVFRVFEEIWSSRQSGYYARFNDTLTTLVAFNQQSVFQDVHIVQDFLKKIDGVYGEFFFSLKTTDYSSVVHFGQWSLEPDYSRLAPWVDDWKRVVQLEDGLFFDDHQQHRLTDVSWKEKYTAVATASTEDPTSCYKYVVCRHPTDPNVPWALASRCCLVIQASSQQASSRHNWFTQWLVPFVHYFPGDQEDTSSVIQWLVDNETAARRVADNGYQLYQRHLTKKGVIDALQSILRRSNYACPPFKFNVDPLPAIPDFPVTWCGIEPPPTDVSLKRLNLADRQACLIQTMVLFQHLQWHYAAYLSRFKIIVTRAPTRLESRDVDDHFFNMPYTVFILIEGPVSYVDPVSQRTNYQDILHNYHDVIQVFGFQEELACNGASFKECLHHFYEKTHKWLPQNMYSRRSPTPTTKLSSTAKVMAHPLPFDHNTNKLVIYRQYQLYAPALTPEYRKAFHKILKRKRRDDVTFDLIDFDAYDWWRLQYDESVPIPRLDVVGNDATHQRLLFELIKVISPVDKPHYLKLFEPLMNVDKVIYSIRYAQLKTISGEQ